MSKLTDRAAYLRGLAEGMGLTDEKNENKLLLEMLQLMNDMAQKLDELDTDFSEMEDYVEEIDENLGDLEECFYGDDCDCDDCDCDDCDCDDCDCDDCEEDDEDQELSFDCPNCGKTVMVKAADIDYDESPVCQYCGQPFFTDIEDEDEEEDDKQ